MRLAAYILLAFLWHWVRPASAQEGGALQEVAPGPSQEQIESALQLGNQFQGMAPRQNQPQPGYSIPPDYSYPGACYGQQLPLWPYSRESRYWWCYQSGYLLPPEPYPLLHRSYPVAPPLRRGHLYGHQPGAGSKVQ